MFTEEQKEIMIEAIQHYGVKNQINKSIEELLELINDIQCLFHDGVIERNFSSSIEELADVKIMLWQLEKMLLRTENHKCLFNNTLEYKLIRLKNRIEIEKGTEPPENKPPEPKSDNPSD